MKLSIGDNVVYGTNGVCSVYDIREEDFGTGKKKYYVLHSETQKTGADIFVPEDSDVLMGRIKELLSPEEIYKFIDSIPDENMSWIDDSRVRSLEFEKIISSGDRKGLIKLIKAIYEKKSELAGHGAKIGVADERVMRTAERMLYEEFAAVLDIKIEDVVPLITKRIKRKENCAI